MIDDLLFVFSLKFDSKVEVFYLKLCLYIIRLNYVFVITR